MFSFKNDYTVGAHPAIMEALQTTNRVEQSGYGEDHYCVEARTLIRSAVNNRQASIFFVSGGTQANLLVLAHLMRPHEAVISAETGHIYSNETGAIEATGHKVVPVQTVDGKLTVSLLEQTLGNFSLRPHVVKPRVVYISNTSELGTIYSKEELTALYAYCQQHQLFLFIDGARLGHALTAEKNDLTLADLGRLSDVFYIGGTKNGALLGEAIVFNTPDLAEGFDYLMKQRGALLAKGRLLGIQFVTLFTDELYFKLAKHANLMAALLAKGLSDKGYLFLATTASNQVFPILPYALIQRLQQHFDFFVWKKIDEEYAAIRLITSWATPEEQIHAFIAMLA